MKKIDVNRMSAERDDELLQCLLRAWDLMHEQGVSDGSCTFGGKLRSAIAARRKMICREVSIREAGL